MSTSKKIQRERARSPFLPSQSELARLDPQDPLVQALTAMPEVDLPGSALRLSDLPVNLAGVRTELTDEQVASAESALRFMLKNEVDAYSANSRRSMRSAWRHWIAFCAKERRVAMPIGVQDLCAFIDALIEAGYKRATIEHMVFTLRSASELWSCEDPTHTRDWKAFWRDRRRTRLRAAQKQAPALDDQTLLQILDAALDADDPRSVRDCAMVACAYDLMTRSSELVALRWEDIAWDVDDAGGANCTIRRSKTDQEGQGATLHLTPATVKLLRLWDERRLDKAHPFIFHALPRHLPTEPADPEDGGADASPGTTLPVPSGDSDEKRPLNVREVTRILERLTGRAQVDRALTGHSARVGAAQDMLRAGLSMFQVQHAGRWTTPTMPARYAAQVQAAQFGAARAAAIKRMRKGQ